MTREGRADVEDQKDMRKECRRKERLGRRWDWMGAGRWKGKM